jgi:hypothetical protein
MRAGWSRTDGRDAPREQRAEPDHVQHSRRVGPQDVVHLLFGNGHERGRRHVGRRAAAGDRGAASGSEGVGVREEEGGGRDVLHVAIADLNSSPSGVYCCWDDCPGRREQT